jgi:hypothetical protein
VASVVVVASVVGGAVVVVAAAVVVVQSPGAITAWLAGAACADASCAHRNRPLARAAGANSAPRAALRKVASLQRRHRP